MFTENMQNFISKNSNFKVIKGESLTPEGNIVVDTHDLSRNDRINYIFSDGENILLTTPDIKSAPDFMPEWDLYFT
jgi:hypothetical protein